MRVKIDNVEYIWNEKDSFEKDGKTYSYASLKKVTTYKQNKKFQTITIKPEHVGEFKAFLEKIIFEGEDDAPF